MKHKRSIKRHIMVTLILVMMFTISGCKLIEDTGEKISQFDADMDKNVNFTQDLSDFKVLELHVNLSVSELNIRVSDDDVLSYSQKANREELLAKQSVDDIGDTIKLTYENDDKVKILSGSQKSEATITIPKDTKLTIVSNVDVGDINIDLDGLESIELDLNTNVGEIDVKTDDAQPSLTYIKSNSDVGEVTLAFGGDTEVLETVLLSSDTGKVSLTLKGQVTSALEIEATADVGDVAVSLGGSHEDKVNLKARADVGDVTIQVPKDHEVKVNASTSEFTSNFEIEDMAFTKSKNLYEIKGDLPLISIDLNISVGDAHLKYSK